MNTTTKTRTALSWSSGKDSAWALHCLRQNEDIELVELVTTMNQTHRRVAMHAVREQLVRLQAQAAGLDLIELPLPDPCTNEAYESVMRRYVEDAKARGIEAIAFGDLFLTDVRAYRESRLSGTGLTPLFPLWQIPTQTLAQEMIDAGLQAIITCVDPRALQPEFVGRRFDAAFLADLPESVDPCGENGEFHTFVTHCPAFTSPIYVRPGEVVEREGFFFADLLHDTKMDPSLAQPEN